MASQGLLSHTCNIYTLHSLWNWLNSHITGALPTPRILCSCSITGALCKGSYKERWHLVWISPPLPHPLPNWTLFTKPKFKSKIIKNFKMARAECGALHDCTGHMPMKTALVTQQESNHNLFNQSYNEIHLTSPFAIRIIVKKQKNIKPCIYTYLKFGSRKIFIILFFHFI